MVSILDISIMFYPKPYRTQALQTMAINAASNAASSAAGASSAMAAAVATGATVVATTAVIAVAITVSLSKVLCLYTRVAHYLCFSPNIFFSRWLQLELQGLPPSLRRILPDLSLPCLAMSVL
jgi:hypothetical protein